MAIFHCYVSSPEGKGHWLMKTFENHSDLIVYNIAIWGHLIGMTMVNFVIHDNDNDSFPWITTPKDDYHSSPCESLFLFWGVALLRTNHNNT